MSIHRVNKDAASLFWSLKILTIALSGGIVVAAVLDKLWDDFKRQQLHEIYSGNAASQGSGSAWPPTSPADYKGLSPDLPMRNVQTGLFPMQVSFGDLQTAQLTNRPTESKYHITLVRPSRWFVALQLISVASE